MVVGMLRCLPLLKACNQQVDYVDKRHCGLGTIPDDILQYYHSLEELLLDGNQIKDLPRAFFHLLQLRKLTLSDNELLHLSADIGNLTQLQELDLSRNDIEEIPENIKYCKNLQIVDLSSNPLQSLPDGFMHLQNLTHLSLNDVSLNRIPYDIGSLTNLESLELRENLIKYLPSSVSFLVRLRALDLGNNVIDALPGCIGCLPSLEELWLDCNDLTEVPWELGNLKRLTQLDLSDNKVEFLPEGIGGMSSLTDFILSHNRLEQLPHGIGNLKKLLILKVDQNLLMELTPEIGNCEGLQELLLTENLLTKLPGTIGKLKMLTNFNVDRNQLTEIPGEIGNCTGMNVFSARENSITRLPIELGNLTDLHVLDVCGNRLRNLPVTLSSCSLKAIWLSENQVQPSIKFQQEFDDVTGQMALTCFLLPQPGCNQIESTASRDFESCPLLVSERSSTSEQGLGYQFDSCRDFSSSVKFALETRPDDEGNEPERHLVRQDTPHPKEPRGGHVKPVRKVSYLQTTEREEPDSFALFAEQDNGNTASPSSRSSDLSSGSKASTVKVLGLTNSIEPHQQAPPPSWHPQTAHPPPNQPLHSPQPHLVFQQHPQKFQSPQQPPQLQPPRFSITKEFNAENEFIFEEEFERNTSQISNRKLHSTKHDVDGTVKGLFLPVDEPEPISPRSSSARGNRGRHVLLRQWSNCDSFENNWTHMLENVTEVGNESLMPTETLERYTKQSDPDEEDEGEAEEEEEEDDEEHQSQQQQEEDVSVGAVEQLVMTIEVLHHPDVPLGMSIAGGSRSPDEGVYVSRMMAGGPCAAAGLRTGDRILSINGTDISGLDHNNVVTLLRQPGNSVSMTISREQVVRRVETLMLRRDKNGLGFTIAGGRGSTPYKGNDQSIYISWITEGGAADKDGRLRVGDRLLSVNGYDMSEATHDSAVLLLTSIVGDIKIVVMHDSVQLPPPPQLDDDPTDSDQPPDASALPPPANGTVTKPNWNHFHLTETVSAKPRGRVDVLPVIAERNSPVSLSDAGSERGLNGGEMCNGFRGS